MKTDTRLAVLAAALLAASLAGCAKKQVAVAPAPPPAPQAQHSPDQKPAPATVARNAVTPRVTAPASKYPNEATRARIDQLLARIEDAYFDYNKASLRPDAVKALQADTAELRDILKDYPDYKLTIEGHCDERGSEEYNMALGDKRATAAKEFLVQAGIPAAQLNLVSYGKDKPVCEDHDEACWQKNRRVHIVAMARNQ